MIGAEEPGPDHAGPCFIRKGGLGAILISNSPMKPGGDMPNPGSSVPQGKATSGAPATERNGTVVPGVFRAVDLDRRLYYYSDDDLWYEYYKGRWHQAFSWNGVWFEPKKLPEPLRDVRLLRPDKPSLR